MLQDRQFIGRIHRRRNVKQENPVIRRQSFKRYTGYGINFLRFRPFLEAEIKAAGYGAMQDVNKNMQSDFQDVLKEVKQSEQYDETMNFNREKESNKKDLHQQKLDLEREKMVRRFAELPFHKTFVSRGLF